MNSLGDYIIAAGHYNAIHTHWGSRLVTPKGNKEERYSRVPRLSGTRYSAKEKWRYASSKARLKCATYRR